MNLPSRRHSSQVPVFGQRLQRTMCFLTWYSGTLSTKSLTLRPIKCSILESRNWYTVWCRHSFWYWRWNLRLMTGTWFNILKRDSEKANASNTTDTNNSSAIEIRNSIEKSITHILLKWSYFESNTHHQKNIDPDHTFLRLVRIISYIYRQCDAYVI